MASKKYKLLLLGILSLFSLGAFAQDTGVYNIFDSSIVPKKGYSTPAPANARPSVASMPDKRVSVPIASIADMVMSE